ncbi:MAG: ABC transporter substrate-binding protein [Sterolibacterium sp.]|jgi:branched-chain amino acid transport system substrate-binding protein
MKSKLFAALLAATSLGYGHAALADITVGITVSATGNGSPLGQPEKNTVALLPAVIAGEKVNYITLDDASDPTQAVKNARKMTMEDKVDVLIGSSIVSNTVPLIGIAAETKTPLLALTPNDLDGEGKAWTFCLPQHTALMAKAIAEHAAAQGYKTMGVFAQADPYGDVYLREITRYGEPLGIKIAGVERFNRSDTSATPQALKLMSFKPDSVLIIAGAGAAAMAHLALTDRGYKGQIYQTHGAANRDALRIGGKAMEGAIFAAGPVLAWNQLPDSYASKKVATEYVRLYEKKYGPNTMAPQGAHMWDAVQVLKRAAPAALKKGKPGTVEFRRALRDAIEAEKDVLIAHGTINYSPTDHFGHDSRARVLLRVENGVFKLLAGK